jgi:6-phosphogluconolactonase (cycloisomerase 2 family)
VAAVAVAAVLSSTFSAAQASQADAIRANALQASRADATHAVFVQTNGPRGNSIMAFRRNSDGKLTFAATYPTGGDGGRTSGLRPAPLASQGSLVLDRRAGLLLAVNAGSDSISVFGVNGDRLHRRQVVSSGGSFPVSIAVSRGVAYVLDAGRTGDVHGYRMTDGKLDPIPGSTRSLRLKNANPPSALSSPGQVGFTPDGRRLVVTTKANGRVDVFSVNRAGRLSGGPAKDLVPGVPFSFTFDPAGRLALVFAALKPASTLGTYKINAHGRLTTPGAPVSDGQVAACWIAAARGFDYLANTASGTISQYRIDSSGAVRLVNSRAAAGIHGPTDMTVAGGGAFLYNQAGLSSTVDAYRVSSDGSLRVIQSRRVPDGRSQEGIVAT